MADGIIAQTADSGRPGTGHDRRIAYRGAVLHCAGASPGSPPDLVYHADGALVVESGRVVACGSHAALGLSPSIPHVPLDGLIVPGFIDAHLHYPQLDIIGRHGDSLLAWLSHHTYPAEAAFADPAHARDTAGRCLDAMARAGTTTAVVYGTVHAHSVDACLEAARTRRLQIICGKALMDRHAPAVLCDREGEGLEDTERLIREWHGRDRLGIAITPRFAPSCTPRQLQAAGELWRRYPGVWVQTHLAETPEEVSWAHRLFNTDSYAGVYDRFGLLGPRALLGHAIHLSDAEWDLLAQRHARIVHCPSSNLFLGSGLFDAERARQAGIGLALGSDIGAGTSVSMLDTAGDAYRVSALRGVPLSPARLFALMTREAADTLGLGATTGHFAPGTEADFCLIRRTALVGEAPLPESAQAALEAVFRIAIMHQGLHAMGGTWAQGQRIA